MPPVGTMSAIIINLESWLAEEAAIVQKSHSDQDAYLFEWLQRLEEYLKSPLVTRVSLQDLNSQALARPIGIGIGHSVLGPPIWLKLNISLKLLS